MCFSPLLSSLTPHISLPSSPLYLFFIFVSPLSSSRSLISPSSNPLSLSLFPSSTLPPFLSPSLSTYLNFSFLLSSSPHTSSSLLSSSSHSLITSFLFSLFFKLLSPLLFPLILHITPFLPSLLPLFGSFFPLHSFFPLPLIVHSSLSSPFSSLASFSLPPSPFV